MAKASRAGRVSFVGRIMMNSMEISFMIELFSTSWGSKKGTYEKVSVEPSSYLIWTWLRFLALVSIPCSKVVEGAVKAGS